MILRMIRAAKKYAGSKMTKIFNLEIQSKNQRGDDTAESKQYIAEAPNYDEVSITSLSSQATDFNRYGGMDAQTDIANPSLNKNKKEDKLWKEYQERKEAQRKANEAIGLDVQEKNKTPEYVGANQEYRLNFQLGEGSFGAIYIGLACDDGRQVAIKLEHEDIVCPQIFHEYQTYQKAYGGYGIPKAYWFGHASVYDVMVIDLLGPDLEYLFNFCGRKLSLKCVLLLFDQLINCIEALHSKQILHRDIKSGNFCIGKGKQSNQVFVLDFGLAKEIFPTSKAKCRKVHNCLIGTPAFASLNAHLGYEQSFRDDLEAIGNLAIYFCLGRLPWEKLNAKSHKELMDLITEQKQAMTPEKLCGTLPDTFVEYLKYCKKLGFHKKPNYQYIRNIFRSLAEEMDLKYDFHFDWVKRAAQRRRIAHKDN